MYNDNELKMTCESISDEYNNEVEVYQYQFYDIIKPKEYVWVGSCNIIINDKYDKYKLPESHYISKGIWVDQFYIDDKYQGKGYGSKIMLILIQKHDINHMACEESNTIALHLYNKMGFSQYDKHGDLIFLKRENEIHQESEKPSGNFNKVLSACKKLYKEWSKYDYGIPVDGHIRGIPSASYFDKNYRFLSPEEFKRVGGGVCWDYVEFGANFLDERDIKYKQLYIITNTPPNYDTHTIIVCEADNQVIYVESSFKKIADEIDGVGIFNSIEDVVKYITSVMFEFNGNDKRFKKFNYDVIEFTDVPSYGATCQQYMQWMQDHGEIIYQGIAYPRKNKCINEYDVYEESTLSSTERDDLVDSEFGIPNKRKYPLTDKTHVLKAVQFFKFADASDRPELAKRIINKAKKFNMDYSNWNSIKEYLPKEFMKEGFYMNYDRFGNPLNQTFVRDNSQIMMEAVSPEQAEENRKENLKLLQYDPKKRTIVVDGPDNQPMTVKAVITNFDVNSADISTGFFMKKQIFVGTDKHGDPYIRIPPAYLTKDPSMLMPLIDHEVEHVNQINYQKQRTGDLVGHFTPRDDECVLEYARKFIKKHGKFLNSHDKLEYELLADFHAATKHGRKSYMKALRNIGEYGLSLKKLKNETIDVLESYNPQLKLLRKGDYSVKSHIKAIEGYIKKCEYIKKNCEKVVELSDKQAETYTANTLFGMTYETNIHDTYKDILDQLELVIDASKDELKTLNSYESDTLNEDDRKTIKLLNFSAKLQTSKPILIAKLVSSIVSTELRGKFIKQIMKDKPWLNNTNNINESYIPEEFNDFDIESEFINEYGYDAFNELSMFLESEGETPDDDFDISSFGSDTFSKSPNNEYDETEVKILNALIADEQHAVGRYFDAAKNSKDKNLSRLYADIGAEERFHAEQLMYSKSMLTGEEYTPFDPEVKKEYEELLAMGMDEESAMTTAIDKRSMLPNYDDEDDSDVDEIQKDVEMLEYAIDCHTSMLNTIDMICESDNFTMEQRDHALNVLLESYIIQEAVDNVRPGGNTQNVINNPVYQLLNGFSSFLKFIRQLCDKFKNFINKNKVKQMRLREFIKTNGIFGIFKPGVSLYFYDPKTPGDLSIAPFQYIELMNNVAVDIMKEHGLTTGLDKINLLSPTISIRYSSATQGLAILNGVVLTKTKIIVDDSNKNAIEELFFGFSKDNRINVNSPDKYDKIMRSGNIYNKLNNLLNWTDLSCKKISKSIQAIQNLQQDTNSIYYTNRNQYNSCIEKLKQVEKCFNKFLKALVSDINTVMRLNNGILEATNAKDDDFNRQMTK